MKQKSFPESGGEQYSNLLVDDKDGTSKVQDHGDDSGGKCGIGLCQPHWLQPLADVRVFVVNVAYMRLVGGLTFSLLVACLTTIEKRFHLKSQQSGIWLSAYEFTNIPTCLLIGYFLSRKHAPRIFAISALLTAFVFFVGALPHFFFGENMELDTMNSSFTTPTYTMCRLDHDNNYDICLEREIDHTNNISYGLLVLLNLMFGITFAPIGVLIFPFLDDTCDVKKAAHYNGIVASMYGVGPLLGFILGAALLTIPINLKGKSKK